VKDSTKWGRTCARTLRSRGSDLPGGGRFIGFADEVLPVAAPVRVVGLSRAPPWACVVTDTSPRGFWRAPRSRSSSPPCLILMPRTRGHRPLVPSNTPRGVRSDTLRLVLFRPSTVRSSRACRLHGGLWPRPGSPSCVHGIPAPTPSRPLPATPCGVPIGRSVPPDPHVPSSWSLTTSTVFSATAPRACCIPLPVMGFAVFRRCAPRLDPKARRSPTPLLTARSRTPRRRPHVDSRTLSPGPLPPWRLHSSARPACSEDQPVGLLPAPKGAILLPPTPPTTRGPKRRSISAKSR
jgi:hypothetical protein